MMRRLCCSLIVFAAASFAAAAQPASSELFPLDQLKPGQNGEVWTVFQGTEPEPFAVEVTGVLRNALGPGKSLIVCQLTDPRVQKMGAVAGMSGSPLYVDGKLAGALSYQIQRFETVRFAGFTPAQDLAEVRDRASKPAPAVVSAPPTVPTSAPAPLAPTSADSPYKLLQPVFTLGGLSPQVVDLFALQFASVGINAMALGGSTQGSLEATATATATAATANNATPNATPAAASAASASLAQPAKAELQAPNAKPETTARLRAGGAVSVALATGDITLAGTGTVSRVDGNNITAFGHPMLSLGDVELPMCSAEIVTILPSQMSSVKMANTGPVIGTITQDRLSAVSGTLGVAPPMIDVDVTVKTGRGVARSLHFNVARQQQISPMIVAAGVSQAILGSNDAGLANGFRLSSNVRFPAEQRLAFQTLYAGPQGFTQGLQEFVQNLAANLQNPYEKTFPDQVSFTVEPLAENPAVTLELFQLSRNTPRAGSTVQLTLAWRDWQGESHREIVDVPVDPAWAGKNLEVVLAPGRAMDELTGRPRLISASELRSFQAYIAAIRDERPADGVCIAVVERAALFSDQTVATPEAPGSIERIARAADEARFRRREAMLPLWEKHVLEGKLLNAVVRRPLQVLD